MCQCLKILKIKESTCLLCRDVLFLFFFLFLFLGVLPIFLHMQRRRSPILSAKNPYFHECHVKIDARQAFDCIFLPKITIPVVFPQDTLLRKRALVHEYRERINALRCSAEDYSPVFFPAQICIRQRSFIARMFARRSTSFEAGRGNIYIYTYIMDP